MLHLLALYPGLLTPVRREHDTVHERCSYILLNQILPLLYPGLLTPVIVICTTNTGKSLAKRAVMCLDTGLACGGVAHSRKTAGKYSDHNHEPWSN